MVADARLEAAELTFAVGRYADAPRLVETTLTQDPFREAAHRLEMRIANAIGDEDRVIAAYRRCERRRLWLSRKPVNLPARLDAIALSVWSPGPRPDACAALRWSP